MVWSHHKNARKQTGEENTELGTRTEAKTHEAVHHMERLCYVQHMDISWKDMTDKATNRSDWSSWIALCALYGMD